jgi:hypothetical protein
MLFFSGPADKNKARRITTATTGVAVPDGCAGLDHPANGDIRRGRLFVREATADEFNQPAALGRSEACADTLA